MTSATPRNELYCTLNDSDFKERRAYARAQFKNGISAYKKSDLSIVLDFVQSDTLRSDLEEFIQLEKQCCGFLTFRIQPEKGAQDEPIRLFISGPPGSESTLDTFVKVIESEAQ